MIETLADYKAFQSENMDGDLFLHIIPIEESIHPAANSPSILFIRNLATKKTYFYAINHPDSKSVVAKEILFDFISKLAGNQWAIDKKTFEQLTPSLNVMDVNLVSYLKDNTIIDLYDYDLPCHFMVRKHARENGRINLAIPLMKHLEWFEQLADDVSKMLKGYVPDIPFYRFNDLIIQTLGNLEKQGIYVDEEKFEKHFESKLGTTVYTQYNVYTSTGRPSNRFGGINYAALNQTDGSRSCFRSRYGKDGKIVVIDYTAFHPRIICTLTQYPISVDVDIYEYLARLYFQKKDIDETDLKNSKQLTFRQLYGGVEDKYSHIKYLANLKTFIGEQWRFFNEHKYVITPLFKRKITEHHIQDPNPSKVFNYILQAVEGEIAIPRIQNVLAYLENKKTRPVLYTYDSVLYDFHKEDGLQTLNEIRKIMSFDGAFPMKTYLGDTYQDVKLVNI